MKQLLNDNKLQQLLLYFLISLYSCGQTITTETYDLNRTQIIEKRDSLFILSTVKEWGRKKWYSWGVRSDMYKIASDEVEYFIGGTFYSPDRKRILVWVGEKMPNAPSLEMTRSKAELNKICPTAGDTIYTLSALIGIRDSVNQIWKLYPFDQQRAGCFDSKDKVINVLGKYYFTQMKTHQMYRLIQFGSKKGHKELEAYGYNLQDKDFWSKCWLWEKDTVGSYGLYPFEIIGYGCNLKDYNRLVETHPFQKKDETNGEYAARNGQIVMKPLRANLKDCVEPYKPPKVDYPAEILNLFK